MKRFILKHFDGGEKFITDTLLTGLSSVFFGLANLLLHTIVLKNFAAAEYSFFSQCYAFYFVLLMLAPLGVNEALTKFVAEKNESEVGNLAWPITFLSFLLGTIVSILFITAPLSSIFLQRSDIFQILVMGLAPAIANKCVLSTYSGSRKMWIYSVLQVLRSLLTLALACYSYFFNITVLQVTYVIVAIEWVLLIVSLLAMAKSFGFPAIRKMGIPTNVLQFSIKAAPLGALGEILDKIPILIAGNYLPAGDAGVFSYIVNFSKNFLLFGFSISYNVNPIISKHFFTGTMNMAKVSLGKLTKTMNRLIIPFYIASLIATASILFFVKTEVSFNFGFTLAAIIMIGICVQCYFNGYYGILIMAGHPGIHSVFFLVMIVQEVILISLSSIYSSLGMAFALTVFYVLFALTFDLFTKKVLKISIFSLIKK